VSGATRSRVVRAPTGQRRRPRRCRRNTGFIPGRGHHARQTAAQPEHPDRRGQREIRNLVDLSDHPAARHDRHDETGNIEDGKCHGRAPGERVTHAAIERIGFVLGESDDVRPRLHARQPASQSRQARSDEHESQPERHTAIETAGEQIKGERPGRDEEHPDPDRPVQEPIVELVPLSNPSIGRSLDANTGSTCGFPDARRQGHRRFS
jgi:hypothetical protein